MNSLRDTWTMAKRSLRHTVRSMDTIITVVATPIAMMLMFVFVFGSSFQQSIGNEKYINFIAPAIIVMTVVSGIAYAAVRLSMDMQKGIINRFKTMPVAPSSILGGHAMSSTLSNLFSSLLVLIVALLIGFRSDAGVAEWALFAGLLVLFTLATTWLALSARAGLTVSSLMVANGEPARLLGLLDPDAGLTEELLRTGHLVATR